VDISPYKRENAKAATRRACPHPKKTCDPQTIINAAAPMLKSHEE